MSVRTSERRGRNGRRGHRLRDRLRQQCNTYGDAIAYRVCAAITKARPCEPDNPFDYQEQAAVVAAVAADDSRHPCRMRASITPGQSVSENRCLRKGVSEESRPASGNVSSSSSSGGRDKDDVIRRSQFLYNACDLSVTKRIEDG